MMNPRERKTETNTMSKVFPELEASDESVVLFMLQPRLNPLKAECALPPSRLYMLRDKSSAAAEFFKNQ